MSCFKRAFLAVLVATGFIGAEGQASIEKVFLSRAEGINPLNGQRSPILLNPTGEVNLTFTIAGIQLAYVNAAGKTESIQIYADYPAPPTEADGSLNRYNSQMKLSLDTGGKMFPGEILRIWAAHASAIPKDAPAGFKPGRLLLKLNGQGRVGFNPAYGLGDVTMIHKDGQKTLDEAIRYTLDVQIRAAMAQEAAVARKQAEAVQPRPEELPSKISVGFITPADTVIAPMCARLFISGR